MRGLAGEASRLTGLWSSKPNPETGGSPEMAEMSPLRRRMIEDMKIRNLSPATQRCYVHAVAKFIRYFKRSPDGLGLAEVRAYRVHLVSRGVSWDGFNQAVCALRFFYGGRRRGARRDRNRRAAGFRPRGHVGHRDQEGSKACSPMLTPRVFRW